jgi:hypothetical protein
MSHLPKLTRDDLEALNFKINVLKQEITNTTAVFTSVNTYNDLPAANLNNDTFFYVASAQGTWWLPESFGGTYYSKGFYYSNGVQWIYAGEVSQQASQADVDAGLINDKFVTPLTLENALKWTTIGGGGGSGAGSSGNGNPGSTFTGGNAVSDNGGAGGNGQTGNGNGLTGNIYGGGGGGARRTFLGARSGGNGSAGFIRITYTVNIPSYSPLIMHQMQISNNII